MCGGGEMRDSNVPKRGYTDGFSTEAVRLAESVACAFRCFSLAESDGIGSLCKPLFYIARYYRGRAVSLQSA